MEAVSTNIDAAIVSIVASYPKTFREIQRAGITDQDFISDYQKVWKYIDRTKKTLGTIPSRDVLSLRFADIDLIRAKERDLSPLIAALKQRRKWLDFLTSIDTAVHEASNPEVVDEAIQVLQGNLNDLSIRSGQSDSLADFFSPAVRRRMISEIRKRKEGIARGLPTGLKRFDSMGGGLHDGRMIVVMARPGIGKSWLDLLFMVNSVIYGAKAVLYPLEMTLEETAFRLYTMFSHALMGQENVFRNLDLSQGKVNTRKLVRFMHMLEDRFSGQLHVADIGALGDPYTTERIDADVDLHRPNIFWVDYLTLMKQSRAKNENSADAIQRLAHGIKTTAGRYNCVGGCSAQVNRDAVREGAFLPRLEHIAYGDAIGQDADQVFSINRKGEYLYYALVKNRHGPEIGKTRLKFFPNDGIIAEAPEDDEEMAA
jgi:replicative DNA helicase